MSDIKERLLNLHDWEVERVATDRFHNTVEILLNMPESNEKGLLKLHGVKRFYLSDMALQNVILDLMIFDDNSDSDYFTHCCKILNIEPSSFQSDKNTKLIYFEPSVGAEIACCFSDFTFDKAQS